jgi:hypothetical protein
MTKTLADFKLGDRVKVYIVNGSVSAIPTTNSTLLAASILAIRNDRFAARLLGWKPGEPMPRNQIYDVAKMATYGIQAAYLLGWMTDYDQCCWQDKNAEVEADDPTTLPAIQVATPAVCASLGATCSKCNNHFPDALAACDFICTGCKLWSRFTS